MDRPKIEDYFTSKRYETANKFGYNITFDSGLYEQALNSYIDQLEKALDKACKELSSHTVQTIQSDTALMILSKCTRKALMQYTRLIPMQT